MNLSPDELTKRVEYLNSLTNEAYVNYLQSVFLDSHLIGVCYAVDSVIRKILNVTTDISEVEVWQ